MSAEMHDVTAEILDRVLNRFWADAMKLGPENLAMASGRQFLEIIEGSREFEIFITGSARTIASGGTGQAWEDTCRGTLTATFQMGIQVGLETARQKGTTQ
jgi:hypothetical protein